ncbi:putative transposase [Trinickia symbiotica]|uniref:Cytosine methyltransferase n=1 Tax=Trinickia symbiotica TaxID=863227 RepID=A0A2N7WTX7_9BURK|nr:RNA-guided endonuclease TnpB family protein [Trinickia symbiotica]PMS32801.1 cytosine methyltransferase [Trinickia symbiotica]PPK42093.1 putative transposase [Trinickia symbiotica]
MRRFQAFKFELKPTGEQQRDMRCFAGSCRYVYNKALALQQENYEAGGKFIGFFAMAKYLTEWRNGPATPWLKDSPIHPLQHALKDADWAYKKFFAKRAGFPRFKKKGLRDSFRYPAAKQVKLDQSNSRIFLPKLGWVRYRRSRDVVGDLKYATVSQRAGKWFVSILTEREVESPLPQATSAVGIDVGIARFATFSDGDYLEPLNSFRRHEARLRRAQRAMSRKKRLSHNWHKAKRRVQNIHAHIANARRDYLHKATTRISQNHAMVCIEDLRVQYMSKSAAGTVKAPGRNVRAKSGLNKSILDQGWYEFRRQLEYKQAWSGGWLIAVPPQNTSCTCPTCGHVFADNRPTQARFACVRCGYADHADVVGAINVLRRGLALFSSEGQDHARIACGEPAQSGHSVKQEPAEAA